MMNGDLVYLDTSGILAFLNRDDACQQALLGRRRKLSLVDLSSFDCMTRLKITLAIAFDRHFTEQGYRPPKE